MRLQEEFAEAERRRRLEESAGAAIGGLSITEGGSAPSAPPAGGYPSVAPPSYQSVARPSVPSRDLKPIDSGIPTAPHPDLVNTVPVL